MTTDTITITAAELKRGDLIASWNHRDKRWEKVDDIVVDLTRAPKARTRGQVHLARHGVWQVHGHMKVRVQRLTEAEWAAVAEWVAADRLAFATARALSRAARAGSR
jgi:hypothetical protein